MTKTNIAETMSAKKLKASLGQSLLSFSFDIGGLLTGAILILYFDVLSISEAPWALFLFPGILSIRGAVGGLFSGHLGTGLHLGTIKATFTKNTKDFHLLLRVIITLAFVSGVSVGTGTWIFGVFLWKATIIDFIQLLAVITATMALSVVFVSPLTMGFSVLSFRRGLDPDIIAYPVTSTMSDIINTGCYILSLSLFFMFEPFGRYLIWILDIIFIAFVVYILVKNLNETKFAETIREFLLTLVFVTVIVNITGSFLTKISGVTGNGKRIYAVYPAIITTVGGVGSIIGSTATTKLALGLIRPSFSSIRQHISEIGGAWLASIVMFVLYSIFSSFISGAKTLGDLTIFTSQLLTTNILAVSVMIFIAYAVAIFTFRRGWNPDNFVIPIESSLADTVTTAAALVALALIT
ncbi:MAG: magnesium transporter [Candidatus Bathyarchaeota archaeon]|nr:magnesium transporter [Candidatus Bathyarchaeota archaeon]